MQRIIRLCFHPSIWCGLIAGITILAHGQNPSPSSSEITFPTQVELGNVFTEGEKVEIPASIQSGASVDWTVTDFEGRQIASGTAQVQDRKASINPGVEDNGYYLVNLVSRDGGTIKGEAKTSYAVIAPVDIAKMPNSKFGVMTHFGQNMPTDFLPLMTKIGISMVRDEQAWQAVEKNRGQFDFTGKLQDYMDELKRLNVPPLIIFAFGNTHYDNQPGVPVYQLAPYTPEGNAAYANYCAEVLKHYGDQIKYVEIWNEYNGSFCAGRAAADRPKSYTAMLNAAYLQIKKDRPDVTVLGGAAVKIPIPYFEKLFKEGALQSMDAIAVHPYQSPEGVELNIAQLVELTKKYNHGQAKPIWATEVSKFGDETVARGDAASHLVRMYTLLLTQPEVEKIFWYLSRDYREFHNLGLIHSDTDPMGKYTPAMPYVAYGNLIHLLYGAKFTQREATDSRTRVYRFDTDTRSIWVCWSTSQKTDLAFTATGPVQLINLVGGEKQLTPDNGRISFTVSENWPVYVVADKGVVTAAAEVPRKDQVLADSVRDFSDEQGKGNWSYFSFGSNKDGSASYDPSKVVPMKWEPSPGDWADIWSAGTYFSLSEEMASPSVISGGQGWAVRRWTSDVDGPIHLVGSASRGPKGDGVCIKVFQDGKELLTKMLPPDSSTDIDLNLTVAKGSLIDFVTTPGPGMDANYDATGYRVTILTQPK